MALIECHIAAKAQPARVSVTGETGRLSAFWSEELAATGHIWPVGSSTDLGYEASTAWVAATALGGPLEWPPYEYARIAGGWLIRMEQAPGEYGYDVISDYD